MSDASTRGWGSPGAPGSPAAAQYRKQHIVTIDVGGVRLLVRREVAPLFAGFIRAIVAGGYSLDGRADDWGYASRYIRGLEAQHVLSNHAWGLAVDLNAADHPLGRRGTGVPDWVVKEAHRWGLFWGGNYKTRPDEMHFEYVDRPEDVARHLASAQPTVHAAAAAPHEEDFMRDYVVVDIPDPRPDGAQVVAVPGHRYSKTAAVTIKANDDGRPVHATVQTCAFGDGLLLSFIGFDGKPVPTGKVGVVLVTVA